MKYLYYSPGEATVQPIRPLSLRVIRLGEGGGGAASTSTWHTTRENRCKCARSLRYDTDRRASSSWNIEPSGWSRSPSEHFKSHFPFNIHLAAAGADCEPIQRSELTAGNGNNKRPAPGRRARRSGRSIACFRLLHLSWNLFSARHTKEKKTQ